MKLNLLNWKYVYEYVITIIIPTNHYLSEQVGCLWTELNSARNSNTRTKTLDRYYCCCMAAGYYMQISLKPLYYSKPHTCWSVRNLLCGRDQKYRLSHDNSWFDKDKLIQLIKELSKFSLDTWICVCKANVYNNNLKSSVAGGSCLPKAVFIMSELERWITEVSD